MRLSDARLRRRQSKMLYPNHRPLLAHRRRDPRSLEPIVRCPPIFLLHTSRVTFPEILTGLAESAGHRRASLRSVAVVATCGEAWRTAWEDRVAAKILTCKLSWRLAQSRSSG